MPLSGGQVDELQYSYTKILRVTSDKINGTKLGQRKKQYKIHEKGKYLSTKLIIAIFRYKQSVQVEQQRHVLTCQKIYVT